MVADLVKERLWRVYVGEIARCRTRVDHVRQRYPSAQSQELAQHLTDTKKGWASTGGAISGPVGLMLVAAGPALLTVPPPALGLEIAPGRKGKPQDTRARGEGVRGLR